MQSHFDGAISRQPTQNDTQRFSLTISNRHFAEISAALVEFLFELAVRSSGKYSSERLRLHRDSAHYANRENISFTHDGRIELWQKTYPTFIGYRGLSMLCMDSGTQADCGSQGTR